MIITILESFSDGSEDLDITLSKFSSFEIVRSKLESFRSELQATIKYLLTSLANKEVQVNNNKCKPLI